MKLHLKNRYCLFFLVLFTLLEIQESSGQHNYLKVFTDHQIDNSLIHYRIQTDSLFNSPQNINIIALEEDAYPHYDMTIIYSDSLLIKTSDFGIRSNASVAINGSYFNMKNGGSTAYLELKGELIDTSLHKNSRIINGALIFDKKGKLYIEHLRDDWEYAVSENEVAVLGSGPVLMLDGIPELLDSIAFVTTRHPRTCLCQTAKAILFITIDGRSSSAAGMNLYEVQVLLDKFGCLDAINLDGGGSTTMWFRSDGKGRILNKPSDTTGERPVANAIILRKVKRAFHH